MAAEAGATPVRIVDVDAEVDEPMEQLSRLPKAALFALVSLEVEDGYGTRIDAIQTALADDGYGEVSVRSVVRRLVDSGYVVKKDDPEDGRRSLLYTTEPGRQAARDWVRLRADQVGMHLPMLDRRRVPDGDTP